MHDKNGIELQPGDKVLFLLAAQVLEGVALRASGPYITVAYKGGEYGIVSERVEKIAPD